MNEVDGRIDIPITREWRIPNKGKFCGDCENQDFAYQFCDAFVEELYEHEEEDENEGEIERCDACIKACKKGKWTLREEE